MAIFAVKGGVESPAEGLADALCGICERHAENSVNGREVRYIRAAPPQQSSDSQVCRPADSSVQDHCRPGSSHLQPGRNLSNLVVPVVGMRSYVSWDLSRARIL
jgi:hypothetical protein